MGTPNSQPCVGDTRAVGRGRRCSSVSTPSATVSMPSVATRSSTQPPAFPDRRRRACGRRRAGKREAYLNLELAPRPALAAANWTGRADTPPPLTDPIGRHAVVLVHPCPPLPAAPVRHPVTGKAGAGVSSRSTRRGAPMRAPRADLAGTWKRRSRRTDERRSPIANRVCLREDPRREAASANAS
jgi:hypothetical protein